MIEAIIQELPPEGCKVVLISITLMGGIGMCVTHLFGCEKKPEPKPFFSKGQTQQVQKAEPKETIPHLLGRKAKGGIIEFGKGFIGK